MRFQTSSTPEILTCFLKRSWEAIKHWADIRQVGRNPVPGRLPSVQLLLFRQHVHNENPISVCAANIYQSNADVHARRAAAERVHSQFSGGVWLQPSSSRAWSSMATLSVCFHHFMASAAELGNRIQSTSVL